MEGKILVTGATGFIGAALCESLRTSGYTVRSAIRKQVDGPWDESAAYDLTSPVPDKLLDGVSHVIHLAGVAHTHGVAASVYRSHIVEATRSLVESAAEHGVERFIYISSSSAVESSPSGCVNEEDSIPSSDPYGAAKYEAERIVLGANTGSMETCCLRPCLVYGPGVKGNLQSMISAVIRRRFPSLPDFGNHRSMTSRSDLVSAILRILDDHGVSGESYFLTDGQKYSTRQIYEMMCRHCGTRVPNYTLPASFVRVLAVIGDFLRSVLGRAPFDSQMLDKLRSSACYDDTKFRSDTGWRSERTFEDDLPEMVKEIRSSLD